MAGKLIVVFGPSGAGKGNLIEHIKNVLPGVVFPVSCTTRAPRPGEVDGQVYHFLSPEEFQQKIDAGEFLEWAEFGGNRYGTLKSEVLPHLESGEFVLRELEIQGIAQLQKVIPKEQLSVIFVDAGSWEELEARIKSRAPITDAELALRKRRYEEEVAFSASADFVVKNPEGELEGAKRSIEDVVRQLLS